MKSSNNQENRTPLDFYWKVQLVCKKVQTDNSVEPPSECNQDKMFLTNQVRYDLFNHFGVTEILWSFRLLLEVKTGKEMTKASRLEFLEKFSAKNFVLSDAEDTTSGILKKEV